MKLITADVVDQARTRKTGRTPIRQVRIDDAINALQSAILDLNVSRVPAYAQSMAVGRAKKDLWAAINVKDRAERLEAYGNQALFLARLAIQTGSFHGHDYWETFSRRWHKSDG